MTIEAADRERHDQAEDQEQHQPGAEHLLEDAAEIDGAKPQQVGVNVDEDDPGDDQDEQDTEHRQQEAGSSLQRISDRHECASNVGAGPGTTYQRVRPCRPARGAGKDAVPVKLTEPLVSAARQLRVAAANRLADRFTASAQ